MGWVSFREDLLRVQSELTTFERNLDRQEAIDVVQSRRAVAQMVQT